MNAQSQPKTLALQLMGFVEKITVTLRILIYACQDLSYVTPAIRKKLVRILKIITLPIVKAIKEKNVKKLEDLEKEPLQILFADNV